MDSTKELAQQIVSVVLVDLLDRAGFDQWWEIIDPDVKESINNDLVYKVNTHLLLEEY
jgi:hypothetical protein